MQAVETWIRAVTALLTPTALALLGLALAAACLIALGAFALGRRRSQTGAAFQALAAEALRFNNESFLTLASEKFRALQESSAVDLGGRQKAIEDLVGPLHEAIEGYRRDARELDRTRAVEAGQLDQQIRTLARQTTELATALRNPGARGRWGELTLRRTVELAGLSDCCDFSEQVSLGRGSTAVRPDLVVHLPSGRQIAVDAKAPLDAYVDAANADSEEARSDAARRHARQLRRHVEALAARGYAERLERAPEFVVLFLPHEGFLATAIASEQSLVADALERGVVLATPATLYALLAAVAQGWRDQRLAENTRQVLAIATQMDERLGVLVEHLGQLGGSLDRTVRHFNATVGSLETRVLPQARRIRELGVSGARDLQAAEPVDTAVRSVVAGAAGSADEGSSQVRE